MNLEEEVLILIRVKEFMTNKDWDIDKQLTDFIAEYVDEVVDIKYNTFLDTSKDIIMSCALLIYTPKFDLITDDKGSKIVFRNEEG